MSKTTRRTAVIGYTLADDEGEGLREYSLNRRTGEKITHSIYPDAMTDFELRIYQYLMKEARMYRQNKAIARAAAGDGKVTLKLEVDIRYAPGTTSIRDLEKVLKQAALHLDHNGLFSGETEAEVLEWQMRVSRLDK